MLFLEQPGYGGRESVGVGKQSWYVELRPHKVTDVNHRARVSVHSIWAGRLV